MSEGTEDLQAAVAEEEPARRIPALAEALGYAGGGLALAAVMTLVGMFWAQLGWSGRTALAAVVAAAAIGGGFALERLKEPAARRLSHFLFVVGVAALGATVGFATHKIALAVSGIGQTANEWAWFCGFLAAAVSGGLLWLTRRNWLQHLAFGVAVGSGVSVGVGCGVSVRNGVTVGNGAVGVTIATSTVLGSSARPAQPVMKEAQSKRLMI